MLRCRPAIPEGAPAEATLKLLRELNNLSGGGRCVVGSGGKSVGETCIPAVPLAQAGTHDTDRNAVRGCKAADRSSSSRLLCMFEGANLRLYDNYLIKPVSSGS